MPKLFLDDYRQPLDCVKYMHTRIGKENFKYLKEDWVIVRNYKQFCDYISNNDLPEIVSFDHDLADGHYHESMYQGNKVYMKYLETTSEKTGYDCAKFLIEHCSRTNQSLPAYFVHSMNPVGTQNIQGILDNFNKHTMS